MKKLCAIALLSLLLVACLQAQVGPLDTPAQVITAWKKIAPVSLANYNANLLAIPGQQAGILADKATVLANANKFPNNTNDFVDALTLLQQAFNSNTALTTDNKSLGLTYQNGIDAINAANAAQQAMNAAEYGKQIQILKASVRQCDVYNRKTSADYNKAVTQQDAAEKIMLANGVNPP